MIIKNVEYSHKFVKKLKKLPRNIIKKSIKTEEIFKKNPLHPSLKLHELHGKFRDLWTISINKNYRLIFERMPNGDIVFLSIGKHDIYKYL